MPADRPQPSDVAAWVRRPVVWQSAVGLAAALIGVLLLILFLPGTSQAPVARVSGTAISRSTFDHWLNSAARTAAAQNPGIPAVPPDPPHYARCVSELRHAQRSAPRRPSVATLRTLCAEDYATLRNAALQLLIDSQWVLKQGQREHIVIAAPAIEQDLARYEKSSFSAPGSLQRYLTRVGQTLADLRFQIAVSLTSTRLEALHVSPLANVPAAEVQAYYTAHRNQFANQTPAQWQASITRTLAQQHEQQALAAYTQQFERYWQGRTTCASGFRVASLCANAG